MRWIIEFLTLMVLFVMRFFIAIVTWLPKKVWGLTYDKLDKYEIPESQIAMINHLI